MLQRLNLSATSPTADREVGSKIRLQEVQKIVKQEGLVEKLTKEEEDEVLRAVKEKRGLETKGARATAKAASIDAAATLKNINEEVRLELLHLFNLRGETNTTAYTPMAFR